MTLIAGVLLGGINLLGISKVLTGGSFLTFRDDKSAYISAFVLALAMCGMGIAATAGNSQMRLPGFILGALLGSINLAIFYCVLTVREIPFVGSLRNGLIAFMTIIAAKMIMTLVIYIQGILGGNGI